MTIPFKLIAASSLALVLAGCGGTMLPQGGTIYNVPAGPSSGVVYNVPAGPTNGSSFHVNV